MPLSPPRLTDGGRCGPPSLPPWQLVLLSTITNAVLALEVQTVF